jgi:oxygen-independent coproporphyrinogen-3 oxidase
MQPGTCVSLSQRSAGGPGLNVGLYVHVPFCRRKCLYCDFNSYAGLEALHAPYVAALTAEMAWLARRGEWQADTVFIGGGTPTALPLSLLAQVLDAARRNFRPPSDAEITVEANPGAVDEAYLAGLRAAGANRLSLGAQSFDDDELRLLGRIHTVAEIEAVFLAARRAGFHNVSLDLIYGLPAQSLAHWQTSLERALALSPEHLSLYSLTVEEGTPFAERVARGDLPSPDDDLAAEMYELAEEALEGAGYLHYEISNWARETFPNSQFVCRHNVTYWRNGAYLGVGAGAHSSWSGRRWRNLLSPRDYAARMAEGEGGEAPWQSRVVADVEVIGEALAMGETMMLGLRLLEEGVSLADFAARFGRSLPDVYPDELTVLQAAGLLEQRPDRVRLTRRGRLLGNQVFARFLPDA